MAYWHMTCSIFVQDQVAVECVWDSRSEHHHVHHLLWAVPILTNQCQVGTVHLTWNSDKWSVSILTQDPRTFLTWREVSEICYESLKAGLGQLRHKMCTFKIRGNCLLLSPTFGEHWPIYVSDKFKSQCYWFKVYKSDVSTCLERWWESEVYRAWRLISEWITKDTRFPRNYKTNGASLQSVSQPNKTTPSQPSTSRTTLQAR